MSAQSQNREILAYLKAGGTITQLEANPKFGCLRLASRINELRAAGHDVRDVWEKRGDKKFKRYYIPSPRIQAIQETPAKKPVTQSLFT